MKYSNSLNSRGNNSTSLPSHFDAAIDEVHLQGAGPQSGHAGIAAAAQERLDPCRQLADCERLDQIVVAFGLQTVDPLVDRGQRADYQNGCPVALASQLFNNREPVLAMQHAI